MTSAYSSGFLDRTLSIHDTIYSYQVYVPVHEARSQPLPVILFLHGSSERGSDGLIQTNVGIGPAIRQHRASYPAIIVFPQAPASPGKGLFWEGLAAEIALMSLEQTMKEFPADPDRVYLAGLSMGGRGVWSLAYRDPARFAALAPICGWVLDPDDLKVLSPVVPVSDAGADPLSAFAQKLRHTPVWVFHGEMDDIVPVERSREVVRALEAVGAPCRYTEYPGLGHNCWDATFASKGFQQWLFAQRRQT